MSLVKERDLSALSQVSVNYLFFGFYFLFISFIHIYHVFLIEPAVTFSRYFFLFYAVVQCAIETLLLILFANAIKIFFGTRAMAYYSLVVFFLMLTHVIDFPLVRFMDMSFWYALNFISAESPQNFLELLYASNVSLGIWILCGLVGFSILFSSIFLYRVTERWTQKKALVIPYSMLAAALCTLCLFLMSWDYTTHKWVHSDYFDQYQKTLPWKSTAIHQRQEFFSLAHRLKEPTPQEELWQKTEALPITLEKRPDIFLFVVESLREDYIDERQAPHLYGFKKSFVSFDLALSNANATQNSWCSLFYSQYPFYWGKTDPNQWKKGSIPLMLLKKLGYKIHCFSSARLNYYQMDKLIFGEGHYLADTLLDFDNNNSVPPCERDRKAIDALIQEMHKGKSGGRLFITFLDSTHHDYSWPENDCCHFKPYEEKINFAKAALSNGGLEQIKNRYRNAIFFVDSLFGRFMQELNASAAGKDAVLVVTGDHGEEFYEGGHLFHASDLCHSQMHVPLYYKFGTENISTHCSMTCHMDIFPTLFHHLTGQDYTCDILQGQSILRIDRRPFTVVARFNGTRSPCEFCIHNGVHRMIASFSDERNIFNAKGLRIISVKNGKEETIPHDLNSLKEQFGSALDHIFAP